MGSFFEESVCRLAPGKSGYIHWFGGEPSHKGVIPPGREHPVHLLYDLDLTDPTLGLASRFPALSRLPLFNALQYNCCDMVYRVVSDDAIEILDMGKPERTKWNANHPFENYPITFPRTAIKVEPVAPGLVSWCINPLSAEGFAEKLDEALHESCLFPRVGGRHLMWQSIPNWACPTPGCPNVGTNSDEGKEVFAVIWER